MVNRKIEQAVPGLEKHRVLPRFYLLISLFATMLLFASLLVLPVYWLRAMSGLPCLPVFDCSESLYHAFGYPEIIALFLAVLLMLVLRERNTHLLLLMISLINLPLYWLACLIPKKENLWLFSCRQGLAYAENSKHFYEYVLKEQPHIDAVWLTRSKKVHQQLKAQGKPCAMAFSPKGYYLSARARCVFFSNFRRTQVDYNDYVITSKTLRFQLWHGSPLKKIGNERQYVHQTKLFAFFSGLFKTLVPFWRYRGACHKMLAASDSVAEQFRRVFELSEHNLWISGYPKNDNWLKKTREQADSDIRHVIYMPTWRAGDFLDDSELFTSHGFDAKRLNKFCADNRIEFHFKLHPFVLEKLDFLKNVLAYCDHLHFLEVDDIYDHLHKFDMLVTDYSSILADYALSGRPIIYACFDLDIYRRQEGFLYDFDSLIAGPVTDNWKEVEQALLADHASYADQRLKLRRMFNRYDSTDSCEKLMNLVSLTLSEPYGQAPIAGLE